MNAIIFMLGGCSIYSTMQHLFSQFVEFVLSVDDLIKFAMDCFGLFTVVYGLTIISSLKRQKREAIFSFWSQLVVRLRLVHDNLMLNNSIINCMYSNSFRDRYEEMVPDTCYIDDFKSQLSDLVEYLKTADAQIPAYRGWSDDFDTIYRFIGYVDTFDIANPDSMFIDDFLETYPDRDEICEEVCSAMSRIINNIHKEQLRYEKKLIPRFRRLILWLSRRFTCRP